MNDATLAIIFVGIPAVISILGFILKEKMDWFISSIYAYGSSNAIHILAATQEEVIKGQIKEFSKKPRNRPPETEAEKLAQAARKRHRLGAVSLLKLHISLSMGPFMLSGSSEP